MNSIERDDFKNIILLYQKSLNVELGGDQENEEVQEEVTAYQKIQKEEFFVEDHKSITKVRAYQNIFSGKVKIDYNFKCAMCGISTKSFLVGSHIVPWSKDKANRLNPANGICLCALHDKAFDLGYVTIGENYEIDLSPRIKEDKYLEKILAALNGKRIDLPKSYPPSLEFLGYHRENVFKAD